MKPKLLITTDCFLPRIDGVAIYLKNLLPYLSKSFEVTIVAPRFRGRIPPLPARIVQMPLGAKIADTWIARWNYRKIKTLVSQSDIIFNHTIGTIGAAAILAASKLKKPLVSHVHSYEWDLFSLSVDKFKRLVRWVTLKLARYLYNKTSAIICPSAEVQHVYQSQGITAPSSIVDVRIPVKSFSTKRESHSGLVIGYCGRIAREKGLPYLLKAFSSLKQSSRDLRLMLVGDGLRTLKWRAKLAGAELIGRVDNPQQYYSQMDIFVMPSLTETTSLSTMEAMSSGLPIVATPVGMVPQFIRKSKDGILVPIQDALALKRALQALIEQPSLRKKMGLAGRAYALKHFDIEQSAKKIVEILLKSSKISN
ncbi:MAG TPA: glycosyltransferase family 4 protein [Candidatus Nanoarchaeia archaeon]|nr:glycosyltransferase family 4 protein [Candidatus Nanoarchaeia archaeon]